MPYCKPLFTQLTSWRLALTFAVLGIALRLFKFFHMVDLDQDEGITYDIVTGNSYLNHIVRNNFEYHTEPFFSHIFHKLWLSLINVEYTFRIPSLLFSIGSIFILWKVLERLFKKNQFVLLSFFLYFCTSNFFIYYGVLFRTYSMGIFLSLVLILKYIDLYQAETIGEKNQIRKYVGFLVLTTISILTSYSSFWVIAGIVGFIFLTASYKRPSSRYLILGALVALPWLIFSTLKNLPVILQLKAESMNLEVIRMIDFGRIFSDFSDFRFLVKENQNLLLLLFPFLILSLYGLWKLIKLKPLVGKFVFATIATAYGLSIIFSFFNSPIFDHKNLWFPNICLIMCHFIALGSIRVINQKIIFLLITLILLLPIPYTIKIYQTDIWNYYETSKTKEVMKYLNREISNKPAVLLTPINFWDETIRVYKDWYFESPSLELRILELPSLTPRGDILFYFYDLENSFKEKHSVELSRKFSCRDVNHSIEGVVFKRCYPKNYRFNK